MRPLNKDELLTREELDFLLGKFDDDEEENPVAEAKVTEGDVWVERDFNGDVHVMLKLDHPDMQPHCWCTFHYDPWYTDNSRVLADAEAAALRIGAKHPVQVRKSTPKFGCFGSGLE